ncbi:hemolysin family protein [Williamsia sterculiae]|uniref:Hemolysin, contains CBS domains n=1 Tax=Williamsia sterculiae TaxID=1344003 RepID=A0A1N7G6R2_9NOCA|nr:hemolysin family protein [Williamsia sterculiae]SIS08293.1 Hemolysin, contains CBS domains [Williamsia sterculiae]
MPDTLLIAAIILVPIGGLFAALDSALLTVSVARVDELVKEGRPGAARLRTIVPQRGTYVGLTVLLRILCEIGATALLATYTVRAVGVAGGLTIAVVAMVLASYLIIGVGPRTLGRQHAYAIAIPGAVLLRVVGVLLAPLTRLLILVGNALTPGKGYRNGPFATEVELRELVDMAEARGVVDAGERRMIQSVFDLGDTIAREVMVPRPEMVWIESDKTAAQAVSLAVRSGHSRIPVIGENPDDVLGVVYLKDLVEQTLPPRRPGSVSVSDLMRPAEFIPDSKSLDRVLADMQRMRNHMALLVDEYGGIAGLVTIEDALEEIVGEINDEYDTDEPAPIDDLGDGRYRVSSRLPITDLGELFDRDIDADEVETVGGLLGLELGRVPLPGASVRSNGLELVAEGGPNRRGRVRITSVVVTRDDPDESDPHDSGSRDESSRSHDRESDEPGSGTRVRDDGDAPDDDAADRRSRRDSEEVR